MSMRTSLAIVAFGAGLIWAGQATAALVYDTSAAGELTGSRTIGDPGVAISGPNPVSAFTIGWVIDFNTTSPGLWHYKYTFDFAAAAQQPQAASHVILDLSDDCSSTAGCVLNAQFPSTTGNLLYGSYDGSQSANPNMMGTIYGVKFDDVIGDSPFVIEFDSVRDPVYGDFYLKAGSETNGWQAQNTGIIRHASSENVLDFIARPDSTGPTPDIPEPVTLALLGAGLMALPWVRRPRGRKKIGT